MIIVSAIHIVRGYYVGYIIIPPRHPWAGSTTEQLEELIPKTIVPFNLSKSERKEDGRWVVGFDTQGFHTGLPRVQEALASLVEMAELDALLDV